MPGATTIDQSGSASTSYLHYDQLGSVDDVQGVNFHRMEPRRFQLMEPVDFQVMAPVDFH